MHCRFLVINEITNLFYLSLYVCNYNIALFKELNLLQFCPSYPHYITHFIATILNYLFFSFVHKFCLYTAIGNVTGRAFHHAVVNDTLLMAV